MAYDIDDLIEQLETIREEQGNLPVRGAFQPRRPIAANIRGLKMLDGELFVVLGREQSYTESKLWGGQHDYYDDVDGETCEMCEGPVGDEGSRTCADCQMLDDEEDEDANNERERELTTKHRDKCPSFHWAGIHAKPETAFCVTLWPGTLGQKCFYGATREAACEAALAACKQGRV